ncbi:MULTISPECIES: TylF/MycF/NovP-related O-methyltransferase [Clostridium]|uniref:TylF/MycF/NovP-related O-methyltransferase n=1 Tax=Clostridium TaxID=1485 RepID=UPI000826EE4F|nr:MULTISPECIES: TylF/MycF/NovP-related O-methyltransferase [Clostridium]PJI09858.1 hypothetical protein CUB90_19160 [Clostridium sp. CT7]
MIKNIIAYGAGAAFRNYLNTCTNTNNILFAIDNNLEKDDIHGIKLYKKNFLKQYVESNNVENYFIVIFAMSSKVVNEISDELMSLGLKYKENFDEYSILIKDDIKEQLEKQEISLMENDYLFTKSILRNMKIDNQSSVIGSWLIMSIIKNTKNLEGDIIELGAYKCGLSYFLTLYKTIYEDYRKYYIVDSFEGFKDHVSGFDPTFLKGMFKDTSYEEMLNLFKDFKDVIITKGFIPEVLTNFDNNKFSVVYYDCDTYESCKQSLMYFYPKLCKGGYFIIHDYFAKKEGATGVKRSVDEFLSANKSVKSIRVPETTHIILRNA